MSNELITSIDFKALLATRMTIASLISKAHELLLEAQQTASGSQLGTICSFSDHQFMRMQDFLRPDGAAKAMRNTDTRAWAVLFERAHILDLMSAKKKHDWRKEMETGKAPVFDEASILGTLRSIYEEREEMFGMSIVECFERLVPQYATHQTTKFGKRIIIDHVTSMTGFPGHDACDQIDDLIRYMTVMDGHPAPHSNLLRTHLLKAHVHDESKVFECGYIHLRCFKNGNGHLTFKRMDLVDRLNQMIAKYRGNALPPKSPHRSQQRPAGA